MDLATRLSIVVHVDRHRAKRPSQGAEQRHADHRTRRHLERLRHGSRRRPRRPRASAGTVARRTCRRARAAFDRHADAPRGRRNPRVAGRAPGTRPRAASAAPAATSASACQGRQASSRSPATRRRGEQGPPLREGLPRRRHLYGADRLTTPLLAAAALEPISWDEAIDIMARRIMAKPQTGFAFYGSGQWTIPEGYAAQKLMKGGPRQQPHRPQRPPLHGVRRDGLLSVRRGRTRGLLRRPRRLRRRDHVGQQPRRDAPGALLARDRPPRARGEGHSHRHRHAPHPHHGILRRVS
jgi:hypothetical protein